jgi:hypothetical protein
MVLPFVRTLFSPCENAQLISTSFRLFIVFAGYFALGAYYNYTTYGATGADLIPCVFSRHLL